MAGENEIVIPISADITKLIEQINKLTGDVEELKSAGQEAGNDIKKAFVGAETAVDGTTKAYQELEKEINDVKNAMKGQRDPKVIANQKQYISELQKEQTELRNTGKAFVNLRTQIKVVRDEMAFLIANGQQGTQRFRELSTQLGVLSDRRKDIQELGNVIGSDTRKFDTFAQAVGGVAAAFSVYQGVLALVGSENKDFQKTMTKVMGAMAVANGVQQIANMLQRESPILVALNNAANKIRLSLTKEQTVAQIANNTATEAGNVATKTMTASVGGISVVGTAAIAVLAGLAYALINYNDKQISARYNTEQWTIANDNLNTSLRITQEGLQGKINNIVEYIKGLQKQGKTQDELVEAELDGAEQLAEQKAKDLEALSKQRKLEVQQAKDRKAEIEARKSNASENSKLTLNEINQINALNNTIAEKTKEEKEYLNQAQIVRSQAKIAIAQTREIIKKEKEAARARSENNKEIKGQTLETKKLTQAQINQLFYTKDWTKELDKIPEKLDKIKTDNVFVSPQRVNDEVEAIRMLVNLRLESGRTISEEQELLWKLEEDNEIAAIENTQYAEELKDAIREKYRKKREDYIKEEKTFWEQNGEAINKWVGVATEAIGIVFAFMQQNSDAELQTISDNFDKQSEKYKTMLDKNLISQEQYDAKVSQLEKEKAAKEKKIKHDAFEQERTAKIINATISGLVGALAQYEAGPAGAILSALVGTLTIANVALIASEKNPYRKGTAQILGGRSHEQGGVSLGSFGEAEQGEFLGILSKRQTSTYGNGLLNLFEGLNKNNKDKVLTGLTDIASNVGFSDTNTNLSVSLNEVREIKSIEKMMKSGNTSVTYHNGYREEKSKGLIRRVYV